MENQNINDHQTVTHPQSINRKISLRYFFKVFLVSIFPIHFWTSLMVFNDIEFVAERTNFWDAVGYAGYSLLFALAESLMIAVVLWLFSLVFPKSWEETRTISVVGSLYLILAGASMVDMAANVFNKLRISRQYLYGLENFTVLTYALILGAILIAMTAALLLILKNKKAEKIFGEFFERVMLLSGFYLFLDLAGLVIVIIRNVS